MVFGKKGIRAGDFLSCFFVFEEKDGQFAGNLEKKTNNALIFLMNNIRNFCIIAHIDHGKSTLADRLLEMTGTVEKRKMKEQLLDTMDLERERGITIKLQPATMIYGNQKGKINKEKEENSKVSDFDSYILNLIDTPGHVDFGYEVSRSLAAVEGAVLLVDATKGVQAQTLANLYQAVEQNLEIIPVVNKIDLPNAEVEKTKNEIVKILGCPEEEVILASGKTGQGVEEILQAIVKKVPPPRSPLAEEILKAKPKISPNLSLQKGEIKEAVILDEWSKISPSPSLKRGGLNAEEVPLRALIFDSKYDSYRGVLAYVRIMDGQVKAGDEIYLMMGQEKSKVVEVGKFLPELSARGKLLAGEIGYIATGFKSVENCRVGDTLTLTQNSKLKTQSKNESERRTSASEQGSRESENYLVPLPGYKEVRPMVYASFYPKDGEDYNQMRAALEKLKLNDAALTFEGESSLALGKGFRLGFLGLLHLEIVQERLRREFGFEPIVTTPGVVYEIIRSDGQEKKIYSAAEMPDPSQIREIREPRVKLSIITPTEYLGNILKLTSETTRARYLSTEYLDTDRVAIEYNSPLSDVIINFHDALKSASSGFASMNYELCGYEAYDLVRMDIYVAEEKVEAFSQIIPREKTETEGRKIVAKLKEVIPRQNFQIKLQAAIGGKVVARENIKAFRKDVTGYLYGGDFSRKKKLLEKQKRGKKKRGEHARAEIPPKAFLEVLKR